MRIRLGLCGLRPPPGVWLPWRERDHDLDRFPSPNSGEFQAITNVCKLLQTCGVRKQTLLDIQASPLLFTATLPVIWTMSLCAQNRQMWESTSLERFIKWWLGRSFKVLTWGMPIILWQAWICWATNGLVGAMKTTLPWNTERIANAVHFTLTLWLGTNLQSHNSSFSIRHK